ncbi:FkbM family methyltransferase [Agrobacterium tumefaciens]|nr:FkbM family methyltransferase [Agrobacterium tumefaciens]NTE18912.1 FkbM family methyltransferase [Agrobacterium tumefaciens]
MIQKFKHILRSILNLLRLRKKIGTSMLSQSERVKPWFDDNGDNTLRINYDLNINSIVFDLGGYQGDWSSKIFDKYCCHIHIFEPVVFYAENIKKRFEQKSSITVYPFGLGSTTMKSKLFMDEDSSSLYKPTSEGMDVKIVCVTDFLISKNIKSVDLIKINIEGSEFDLLEHLIQEDALKYFRNIQVQFHDFFPDARIRMEAIQRQLKKTHSLTYQYEFVWENWKLNDDYN